MSPVIFLIISNILLLITLTLPLSLKLKDFSSKDLSLSDLPKFGKYKEFAFSMLGSSIPMFIFIFLSKNTLFANAQNSWLLQILSLIGISVAALIRFDKHKKVHSLFGAIYYIGSLLGMFMFAIEVAKVNLSFSYATFVIAGSTTFICQLVDRYFKGDYILEVIHAISITLWIWLIILLR